MLFLSRCNKGRATRCSKKAPGSIKWELLAMSVSVNGCFSTQHCEKLATHPGCNPTFTQRQLGQAPTTSTTLSVKQYSVDGALFWVTT